MGQQQLLLMILVTIIVGIMTVVAISIFSNARDESINDLIRQDLMEAASIGQMYYRRHQVLGGGGESFNNITLNNVQLDSSNAVTTFEITERSAGFFKITATPSSGLEPITAVIYPTTVEWE